MQSPTDIPFTISDLDSPLGSLTTQVQSSNPQLIAPADLVVTGSGGARTLSWLSQPNVLGSSIITITVSDGALTSNQSFQISIVPNSAPTVSAISPVNLDEDQTPTPIAFTIQDLDTNAGSLIVSAHSSNQSLISDQSIQLGGTGSNRSISWTPVANGYGSALISLSVSDGTITTTRDISITVNPVNDAPLANDDLVKQVGGQEFVISLTTLLSNDSDLDGDALQWFQDTQPSHGRLELVGGSLRYTPTDFGAKSDAFTYRVFDGTAWSQPVTVQLQLDPNAFAGFINLAINSGGTSSNVTSPSSSNSTTSDTGESQIDAQSTASKAASSQSESSNTSATSNLALQVSMAMVAQSAPHASHGHGGQNSDLVSMLPGTESVVRNVDGTTDNEFDPGSFTNQSQLSVSSYIERELGESQQNGIHSQWMNSVQTTGVPQPLLWEKIGELRHELRSSLTMQSSFTVGTAATTTAGMTVGYVAWVMRSGLLFSSMMTQLPIWRFMDPLAILESTDAEESESDDETINSMVDGDWEADEPVDPETAVSASSQT